MFCHRCGTQLPDGSSACWTCGAPLTSAAPQQPFGQQPAAQQPFGQQAPPQQVFGQQAPPQQAFGQQPFGQQPAAQQPFAQQAFNRQAFNPQSVPQQASYGQQPYQGMPQQPYRGFQQQAHYQAPQGPAQFGQTQPYGEPAQAGSPFQAPAFGAPPRQPELQGAPQLPSQGFPAPLTADGPVQESTEAGSKAKGRPNRKLLIAIVCAVAALLLAAAIAATSLLSGGRPSDGEGGFSPFGSFGAPDVKISAETFPDDTFREFVAGRYDTNGDGTLSGEEAMAVTEIGGWDADSKSWESPLDGMGIKSLEGIECFPALKSIVSVNNNLLTANFSNNGSLETIVCVNDGLDSVSIDGIQGLQTGRFPSETEVIGMDDSLYEGYLLKTHSERQEYYSSSAYTDIQYTYGPLGQLVKEVSQSGGFMAGGGYTKEWEWSGGEIVKCTLDVDSDFLYEDVAETFEYGEGGRLVFETSKHGDGSATTVYYNCDDSGALVEIYAQREDPDDGGFVSGKSMTIECDDQGRVVKAETTSRGGEAVVLDITRDGEGRVIKHSKKETGVVHTPDGLTDSTIEYKGSYNEDGTISSFERYYSVWEGDRQQTSLGYENGMLTTMFNPNSSSNSNAIQITYDSNGRLKEIGWYATSYTPPKYMFSTYTYDEQGNISRLETNTGALSSAIDPVTIEFRYEKSITPIPVEHFGLVEDWGLLEASYKGRMAIYDDFPKYIAPQKYFYEDSYTLIDEKKFGTPFVRDAFLNELKDCF